MVLPIDVGGISLRKETLNLIFWKLFRSPEFLRRKHEISISLILYVNNSIVDLAIQLGHVSLLPLLAVDLSPLYLLLQQGTCSTKYTSGGRNVIHDSCTQVSPMWWGL